MNVLEIVLKISERCNINCTYCYFFNYGEESYKKNPPIISFTTIKALCFFIKKAIDEFNLNKIIIGFHGGEPLLIKRGKFKDICDQILLLEKHSVKIAFSMQTNAMLINEEWVNLFKKYNVGVGVSIDGIKKNHDLYRIDHNNNGTYDRVIQGIKKLQLANIKIGVIAVINPSSNPSETYQHLAKDLNLQLINFLLEDLNYETIPKTFNHENLAEYLCNLFIAWISDHNNVDVIMFSSIINMLLGSKYSRKYGIGPTSPNELPLLTVSSSGNISPSDEIRPLLTKIDLAKNTIYNTNLSDIVKDNIFQEIDRSVSYPPTECSSCEWVKICGGGPLVTRFSKKGRFNNPSIYCSSLKELYSTIVAYMLEEGYDYEKIQSRLI